MSDLYDRIKALCDRKEMAIAQLERAAGLGNGTVGKWQNASPNLAKLDAVAKVLGTTSSELLRRE